MPEVLSKNLKNFQLNFCTNEITIFHFVVRIGSPAPSPASECYPTPLGTGAGDTLACGRGSGGSQFGRRNRHSGTLGSRYSRIPLRNIGFFWYQPVTRRKYRWYQPRRWFLKPDPPLPSPLCDMWRLTTIKNWFQNEPFHHPMTTRKLPNPRSPSLATRNSLRMENKRIRMKGRMLFLISLMIWLAFWSASNISAASFLLCSKKKLLTRCVVFFWRKRGFFE